MGSLPAGSMLHFRYLAEGGGWFGAERLTLARASLRLEHSVRGQLACPLRSIRHLSASDAQGRDHATGGRGIAYRAPGSGGRSGESLVLTEQDTQPGQRADALHLHHAPHDVQ